MTSEPDKITKEQMVAFRKRRGLSQQDMATMLGVSLPTIKRWESGESVPRDRHMVALAALLGGTASGLAVGASLFPTSLGLASALVPSLGLGPVGPLLVALGALPTGFLASQATSKAGPVAPELPSRKAGPEAPELPTSDQTIRQLEQLREQVILQLPIPLTAEDRAKAEKVRLEVDIDRVLFDKFHAEANVRGFTPSRLLESLLWMFMEMPPLSFQKNDRSPEGGVGTCDLPL